MSHRSHLSRRNFLKLAGAGVGAALVASCNRRIDLSTLPSADSTPFPPGTTADTILTGGRIMTVDASNSIGEAIAIQGNRILTVGPDDAVRELAGSTTKIIELNGRTVTPGFIDPHLHFSIVGLQNTYYTPFMPPDVNDIPSLQSALADHLAGIQPGEWVMGYYLGLSDKMVPTKEDLDPVSGGNPVFLMHIGGHWGTANSVAMQIAGVTNSTASPEGGIIEKINGELTGVFYNHRAMDVLRRFAPPVSIDAVKQGILEAQRAFASCGVTCFHDNNIRAVDNIRAYQELSQSGQLFLRNELYLTLEWPSDMERVALVQPLDNEVTHFAGYKFLIDGQGPTAYCHEAHNGVEWRLPTWEPQNFKTR